MAREILNVSINLDRIHAYDEGDGWGDAEPYLWTVFFKIDGDTMMLDDSLHLVGTPVVVGTPGSHGNLGTTDVNEGDNVPIPEAIGYWQSLLKPIPVADSVKPLAGEDLPGVIGVAVVLMEQDNVSDSGAEAGHQALNAGVLNALEQIVASLGVGKTSISDDDINQFMSAIQDQVTAAVKNAQSTFENIWSWLNSDDTIGTKVWHFATDDLAPGGRTDFSQRWHNEGDWELFGHLNAVLTCPADAVSVLAKLLSDPFAGSEAEAESKQAMRKFRDSDFGHWPGLADWWNLAVRNAPQIGLAMGTDAKFRHATISLLSGMREVLANRDKPIPKQFLEHAETLLTQVRKSGPSRARIDASRALDVLERIRERTPNQAFEMLSAIRPARHPRAAGGPRICKNK